MADIDVRIEWHSPDQVYVATFVRDGEPWHVSCALVGFGPTPGAAVTDLCENAEHLVIEGYNFMTDGVLIPVEDRVWLFGLLDIGSTRAQEMYEALRAAGVKP